MKAIGIVGSPRNGGNTELLTAHCLQAVSEEGLQTELIKLADLDIRPCNDCRVCRDKSDMCPIDDDLFPIYKKMKEAEAIILASPVYLSSVTALLKALMERTSSMGRNTRPFSRKVGGPLVVGRRAGKTLTFVELMQWFYILGMIIPGSTYWNVALGLEKGDVREDKEGLATAWDFGKNVAYVVKGLYRYQA